GELVALVDGGDSAVGAGGSMAVLDGALWSAELGAPGTALSKRLSNSNSSPAFIRRTRRRASATASVSVRSTVGRMKMINSVRVFVFNLLLKRCPSKGMSPKIGTLDSATDLFSVIN